MKKILFIHHAAGWGGGSINLIENIKGLDKQKYNATVLLIKDSIVSIKLKENDIDFIVANSFFYKKIYKYFTHSEAGYLKWHQVFSFLKHGILWLLSKYYFAKKELRNIDYDIVQVNSSVLTDWLKACSQKAKVTLHVQEPFRKGKLDFLHYFFRHQMKKYADRIIAISNDNAKRVNLIEKTTVIYNFAEIPSNTPSVGSYSSKKFLYLGGASYIKGFFTLVKALDYLDEGVVVFFGGRYDKHREHFNIIKKILLKIHPYHRKQNKAIEKMRKNPRAIEIGLVENANEYYNQVCCLISPFSKPHFSRPVIEAYLHTKPAIGSDVQGMDEIIEQNKTGLLFSKNNSKDLAKAINYIANNPEKARQMGENGFKIAKKHFTPANVKKIEHVYNSLI